MTLLLATSSTFFLAGLGFFLGARRRSERASLLVQEAAAQRQHLAEHFSGLARLEGFLGSQMGVAESIARCRSMALDLARVPPEHWTEHSICVAHDLDYLESTLRMLQGHALDAKLLARSATYQAQRHFGYGFLGRAGLDDAFSSLASTHRGCPGTAPLSEQEVQLSEEFPPPGGTPRRSANVPRVDGPYRYPVEEVVLTELPPSDGRCACPPTEADFEWLRRTAPSLFWARERLCRARAHEDQAYLARLDALSSLFRRRHAIADALAEDATWDLLALRCLSRLQFAAHGLESMRGGDI